MPIKQKIMKRTVLSFTYDQMPDKFSTNLFVKHAIENGYSQSNVQRGHPRKFLKSYCKNTPEGSNLWEKVYKNDEVKLYTQVDILEAIKLLKLNGYKVYKVNTNFNVVEV